MNKKQLLEYYEKELKSVKHKKRIRCICAIIVIAAFYYWIFKGNIKVSHVWEYILIIIGLIVLSIVDWYVHLIIYLFTFKKNEEDSIKLEKLEKEVFK